MERILYVFHGPQTRTQTDIGYTVSSNSFTVDMFDGFDMVMLGDIHKRQTFGKGYEHICHATPWFYDSTKSWRTP